MALHSYIDPAENREATRKPPRLMAEGFLLGGSGLVVRALICEITPDAEAQASPDA